MVPLSSEESAQDSERERPIDLERVLEQMG
jgi:hypothetical protein